MNRLESSGGRPLAWEGSLGAAGVIARSITGDAIWQSPAAIFTGDAEGCGLGSPSQATASALSRLL